MSGPWDLSGQVAIVTGASSGIGRATALLLAARGAQVLGVARSLARLDSLVAEAAAAGGAVIPHAADLSVLEACPGIVQAARRLGRPGILVHSAGIGSASDAPIFSQGLEAWRASLTVNLDAVFWLTRHAAADLRDHGAGRMVVISSTAGEIGAPSMSPYCSAKHGVIGLMRSVALDLAPHGGTANAVLPGWVRSEMSQIHAEHEAAARGVTPEQIWQERADSNPAGRIATAQELAQTIAFLVSPAASGINGQAITVACGSLW